MTDNMFVAKDSTRILDKTSGGFISIPTKDIRYIIDIHHTLGAFEWIAVGAAIGVTYGIIIDKTAKIDRGGGGIDPKIATGFLGGIIGIIPGAIIGHKIYWVLPSDSSDSVTTNTGVILK